MREATKKREIRKKGMRQKWFRELFRRRFIVILLLIAQIVLCIALLVNGTRSSVIISQCLNILSILVILHVISRKDKGAFKTAWVFLILAFPPFGGALYLFLNLQTSTKKFSERFKEIEENTKPLFGLPKDSYEEAGEQLGPLFPQVRYLQNTAGFPVFLNTQTQYLSPGEDMFEAMLQELRKAEKYIFLEYFILEDGIMWDSVLSILKEKAASGVKVRLIYDDLGCFLLLPKDFCRQMEAEEIFSYIRKYGKGLLLPDQDIFNALYGEDTLQLDDRLWNYDVRHYKTYRLKSEGICDMDWVMQNTAILHFCGKKKPWAATYGNSFGVLYKHYVNLANR